MSSIRLHFNTVNSSFPLNEVLGRNWTLTSQLQEISLNWRHPWSVGNFQNNIARASVRYETKHKETKPNLDYFLKYISTAFYVILFSLDYWKIITKMSKNLVNRWFCPKVASIEYKLNNLQNNLLVSCNIIFRTLLMGSLLVLTGLKFKDMQSKFNILPIKFIISSP